MRRSWTRRGLAVAAAGLSAAVAGGLFAQGLPQPPAAPQTAERPVDPLLRGFRWRSIGPTGQGGRIDDLAVDEKNPSTYYVGFAVSGVWKTVNNGTTFEPIFDTYGVSSIGDLALAPSNPNVLYVGTGEANYRQTSSFGNGIWKSTDAGAHFTNVGLRDSQSIARIVVHPKDPDTVWVAAAGHLFGPNEERGVFMTADGGRTWTRTLYVDEDTGATDLVIDPGNSSNLWAAMYEHRRTAWGFAGGGPGSGLYRSTDGGKSWKKAAGIGLPNGTMGRIGLDICRAQPSIIYAQIEVAADKEPADSPAAPAAGRGGRGQPLPPDPQLSGIWRSTDKGKSWQFMSNQNQRPMYFSQIRADPNDCNIVYVGGVNAHKSADGGRTFVNIESHKGHVDNHAIWIDPANSKHVMYGTDGGLDVSWDAGVTWESVRLSAVGLAYHVSADLRHPYWVCTGLQDNGSWCGPSQTRSGGIHMWNWFNVGGGDGFQSQIDPTNPNIIYAESQNLGLRRYDLATGQFLTIRPNPLAGAPAGRGGAGGSDRGNVVNAPPPSPDFVSQFNWNAPVRLSPHNPQTLYVAGRHLFISRDRGDSWTMTQPLGKNINLGARRILDQSYALPACGRSAPRGQPCILSKHDGHATNEFGTATELAESPVLPGVLWVGTDDGNVQVSRDGGQTFVEVGRNIPNVSAESYVSGLEASWFDAATAYVALDRHRNDDYRPYIFKTTDYGQSWTAISGSLPAAGHVNSIRQDPVNKNLLYAPTEVGFYVSLDEGRNWMPFMPGLPDGRVDDVIVHPREHDLILATHSRSIWIMDDISPLQQLATAAEQEVTLFKPRDAVLWHIDRRNMTETPGDKIWEADPPPRGTAIAYLLKAPAPDARVLISDTASGQPVFSCVGTAAAGLQAGMNRVQWTLVNNQQTSSGRGGRGASANGPGPLPCVGGRGRASGSQVGASTLPVRTGAYKVTLTIGEKEVGSQTFSVLEDVWMHER